MATAKRGFGSLLKRETTPSSGTFTTIGGLTNLNWPAMEADVVESTDMEAPSAARQRTPTLIALGDLTADINFDSADATQEQLQADLAAQTIRLYQIVGSDNGAADWRFNAYVTRFAPVSSRDGLVTASLTLTPTGPVTRA